MGTATGISRLKKYWVTKYEEEVTRQIEWADGSAGSINFSFALTDAGQEAADEKVASKPFEIQLTENTSTYSLVPGSVSFTWAGNRYIDRLGKLYRNPSKTTGLGALAGSIDYSTGRAKLDVYDGGDNAVSVHSLTGRFGNQFIASCVFRTPGAPLRPGSISINGTTRTGKPISGTSNMEGMVTGENVEGFVDYENGIVSLLFGSWKPDSAEYVDEAWYADTDREGDNIWVPEEAYADQLTYACVIYSYIPLDANLIGLDPVRLPSDGRVPIVKTGDVVVVHNTKTDQLPDLLPAGKVITLSRPNVASVEIYDSSEVPRRVTTASYTWDKEKQTITINDQYNDFSEYTKPLICMHRVEDMLLVSGTQINGQVTFATGVQNDYPVEGTYISTALLMGDLQARAYGMFDQKTWKNEFSDDLDGDAAVASYNEINFPPIVTNSGGVRERWALVWQDDQRFLVIGETYGIVAECYKNQDCQPINTATNQPFFFLNHEGWGEGWSAGNVLRFNTEGASHDLWIARTTLQGPPSEPSDFFTLQIRGDAE